MVLISGRRHALYRDAQGESRRLPTRPAIGPRLNCSSGSGMKGTNVNDDILNAIDEEIAALRQARDILAQSGTPSVRKNPAATVTHNKPRRKLSAQARKAIADAQH